MIILQTPRLTLRHMNMADAPFLLKLMNEPSYYKNIGDRGVRTIKDAEKYIAERYVASYEKNGFGLFTVDLKANSEPIGICGLIKRDALEDIDIGFAFLSTNWGQGFAVESALGVVEYAKNKMNLSKIVAICLPENKPSVRVLEKIGMKFDRMIKLPDIKEENSLYSLNFANG